MLSGACRILMLLSLAIATGCEAARALVGIFSLDSQSRAIDRSAKNSPNEQIQYERSQAHQQLDHQFDGYTPSQ